MQTPKREFVNAYCKLTHIGRNVNHALFPKKSRGKSGVADRSVLDGIFWGLRGGVSPGEHLARYGLPTTI